LHPFPADYTSRPRCTRNCIHSPPCNKSRPPLRCSTGVIPRYVRATGRGRRRSRDGRIPNTIYVIICVCVCVCVCVSTQPSNYNVRNVRVENESILVKLFVPSFDFNSNTRRLPRVLLGTIWISSRPCYERTAPRYRVFVQNIYNTVVTFYHHTLSVTYVHIKPFYIVSTDSWSYDCAYQTIHRYNKFLNIRRRSF